MALPTARCLPLHAICLGDNLTGKRFTVRVGHEHGDHDVLALIGPAIRGLGHIGVKVTFVDTHGLETRHVGVRKTFHSKCRFSVVVVRNHLGRGLLVPVVPVELDKESVVSAPTMLQKFRGFTREHGPDDDGEGHCMEWDRGPIYYK